MAFYSEKQTNQMYVIVGKVATAVSVQATKIGGKVAKILKFKNARNEDIRTDLLENVRGVNVKAAAADKIGLAKVKVDFTTAATALTNYGADIVLHVSINNAFGFNSPVAVFGDFYAAKNATAATIAAGVAASLTRNIKKWENLGIEVSYTAGQTYLYINQLPHKADTFAPGFENFDTLIIDVWGTSIWNQDGEMEGTEWLVEDSTVFHELDFENNSFKVADMEFFYHGKRGDMYRGNDYPNDIQTKYLAVPADDSDGYDIVTVEFYYEGTGVQAAKSEKTAIFAVEAGQGAALAALIDSNITSNVDADEESDEVNGSERETAELVLSGTKTKAYTVASGVTATSSKTSIATVAVSGTTATVTGVAAGKCKIKFSDGTVAQVVVTA